MNNELSISGAEAQELVGLEGSPDNSDEQREQEQVIHQVSSLLLSGISLGEMPNHPASMAPIRFLPRDSHRGKNCKRGGGGKLDPLSLV